MAGRELRWRAGILQINKGNDQKFQARGFSLLLLCRGLVCIDDLVNRPMLFHFFVLEPTGDRQLFFRLLLKIHARIGQSKIIMSLAKAGVRSNGFFQKIDCIFIVFFLQLYLA